MWVGPSRSERTGAPASDGTAAPPVGGLLDKENGEHVLPSPYATDVMR
jgi:hypothetical protein